MEILVDKYSYIIVKHAKDKRKHVYIENHYSKMFFPLSLFPPTLFQTNLCSLDIRVCNVLISINGM